MSSEMEIADISGISAANDIYRCHYLFLPNTRLFSVYWVDILLIFNEFNTTEPTLELLLVSFAYVYHHIITSYVYL